MVQFICKRKCLTILQRSDILMKRIFVSKKAQKHSSKGDFERNRVTGKLVMKGGGHGQENIDFLNKKGIYSNITVEYNNGVRLGNVSNHKRAKNRERDGQCWFPEEWTKSDIKKAGQYVMRLKKNKDRKDQMPHWGTVKGVKVGVYTQKGFINTIFPCYIQKGGRRR